MSLLYQEWAIANNYFLYFLLIFQDERPLYLQLEPSKALLARALVRVLNSSQWYYASIIEEDAYASDGFMKKFSLLTSGSQWHIEDNIKLNRKYTDDMIDLKLRALQENKSRVMILHCSLALARSVFRVAKENGLTGQGYAWFVTEDIVVHDTDILDTFPVGLIGVTFDHVLSYDGLVPDLVDLVSTALNNMQHDHSHLVDYLAGTRDCGSVPHKKQLQASSYLYR